MRQKIVLETEADFSNYKKRRISMTLERDLTLSDVLAKFINIKQATNLSPKTIKGYGIFFKRFIKLLRRNQTSGRCGARRHN
jgi:hypothetical protein